MSDGHVGDFGDDSGPDSDTQPIVYDLVPNCTVDDVEIDTYYRTVANGVMGYDIFVDVSDPVSGLIHESDLSADYKAGDRLTVRLESARDDDDIAFAEDMPDDYRTLTVDHEPTIMPISSFLIGGSVVVEGVVT